MSQTDRADRSLIVIGAGIAGLATAIAAREAGYQDVSVLESAGHFFAGASGVQEGGIHQGHSYVFTDPHSVAEYKRSAPTFDGFPEDAGTSEKSTIYVALEDLPRLQAQLTSLGLPWEPADMDEVHKILTPPYPIGAVSFVERILSPSRVLRYMEERCRELGVNMATDASVDKISHNSTSAVVQLQGGRHMSADAVVIAAGLGTKAILEASDFPRAKSFSDRIVNVPAMMMLYPATPKLKASIRSVDLVRAGPVLTPIDGKLSAGIYGYPRKLTHLQQVDGSALPGSDVVDEIRSTLHQWCSPDIIPPAVSPTIVSAMKTEVLGLMGDHSQVFMTPVFSAGPAKVGVVLPGKATHALRAAADVVGQLTGKHLNAEKITWSASVVSLAVDEGASSAIDGFSSLSA